MGAFARVTSGNDNPNVDDPEKPPRPSRSDVAHSVVKGALSGVPLVGGIAAELLTLAFEPPLSKRRDEWMESLWKKLKAAEAKLESLQDDPAFFTTILQATQIALRTHQEEKLEALLNAVANSAVRPAPEDDVRALFLNFIEGFTPTHLRLLRFFQSRNSADPATMDGFRSQRDITDQMVNDLSGRGLIQDTRPYAARGRLTDEPLFTFGWTVTNLGAQFLKFISAKRA